MDPTGLYSQLKSAWHPERVAEIRSGRAPVPVHVQLVLSDLCNQDCSFCAYRMSEGLSRELFGTAETHNPNRRIDPLKAEEIIRDCAEAGVRAIQFTGGGEPTVHPDHAQLFALAQGLGLETALVTNGVRLRCEDSFLAMRWVRVSIDAGTAETYARVRGVHAGHWGRVWQNLGIFSASYRGELGVGFVVTPENYRELRECAKLCAASGVKNLRIGAVFSSLGTAYYGSLVPQIEQEIAAVIEEQCGGPLEVVSLFRRRIQDLLSGAPGEPECGYQYLTTYIGADLSVYRCCNTAYSTRGTRGSLKARRFSEYLSTLKVDAFDARKCRYCQFSGQNRAIAAGASAHGDQPEHVNFV